MNKAKIKKFKTLARGKGDFGEKGREDLREERIL